MVHSYRAKLSGNFKVNVSVPSSKAVQGCTMTSLFIVLLCLAKKWLKRRKTRGTLLFISCWSSYFWNVADIPATAALIQFSRYTWHEIPLPWVGLLWRSAALSLFLYFLVFLSVSQCSLVKPHLLPWINDCDCSFRRTFWDVSGRLHLKEPLEMKCWVRPGSNVTLWPPLYHLLPPPPPHTPEHCEEDCRTFLLFLVGEIREIQENIWTLSSCDSAGLTQRSSLWRMKPSSSPCDIRSHKLLSLQCDSNWRPLPKLSFPFQSSSRETYNGLGGKYSPGKVLGITLPKDLGLSGWILPPWKKF